KGGGRVVTRATYGAGHRSSGPREHRVTRGSLDLVGYSLVPSALQRGRGQLFITSSPPGPAARSHSGGGSHRAVVLASWDTPGASVGHPAGCQKGLFVSLSKRHHLLQSAARFSVLAIALALVCIPLAPRPAQATPAAMAV